MEELKIANTLLDMKTRILKLRDVNSNLTEEHFIEIDDLNKVINEILLKVLNVIKQEFKEVK